MSTSNSDVRWKQRLANYKRALAQLTKFIKKGELNELEEQGLIQSFEYTHELAWNLLRDYLRAQGNRDIYGSKDATRLAFKLELIEDGQGWMDMIRDRNLTSHTYNEDTAAAIASNITEHFFFLLDSLAAKMQKIQDAEEQA